MTDTSIAAGRAVAPHAASQRLQIVKELASVYPSGMTGYELHFILGCSPNNACARLVELLKQNLIRRTGQTRVTTREPYRARVHVLTEKGLKCAHDMRQKTLQAASSSEAPGQAPASSSPSGSGDGPGCSSGSQDS